MNENIAGQTFISKEFFALFEQSGCIGERTGWFARHFQSDTAFLPSYVKTNSFGEYIFDWEWAQFYESHGLNYYPKLTHAVPFMPINIPKFIGDKSKFAQLAQESFAFCKENSLSGEHYLFINDEEQKLLQDMGFFIKITHQYHFQNRYNSFEDFLASLKKSRRKTINKERQRVQESGLRIETLQGSDLGLEILKSLYRFYLLTIAKKGSYAYLTEDFFLSLPKANTLITCAYDRDRPIAMALFLKSDTVLYGRNWGMLPEYEARYPFLHFELCYYRAIEYCIDNKLKLFEAGAQGEHKLLRGFKATPIASAHHLTMPQCHQIIKSAVQAQNRQVLNEIERLNMFLPFKNQ